MNEFVVGVDGSDVGTDGSEGAQRALAWAQTVASATGANLRAAHAWRRTVSEVKPQTADRLRSRAADAVQGWVQEVGVEIESDEVEGDPREVLVDTAERFAAALTVVGRRGRGTAVDAPWQHRQPPHPPRHDERRRCPRP